jgi:hypothetical protein
VIERHWGLERRAFANTPDPEFVYRSPAFAEALARLLYDATQLRGGLSLITGEIGCGKTMLAQTVAAQLTGSPTDVIALAYPKVTPAQMLGRLALGIGLERPPRGKLPLIEAIGARLADLHRNARRPVLVVDEAQLASPSLLEEIRLLTNFEDRQDKHLHVVSARAARAERPGAEPAADRSAGEPALSRGANGAGRRAWLCRASVAGRGRRRVANLLARCGRYSGGAQRRRTSPVEHARHPGAVRRRDALPSPD